MKKPKLSPFSQLINQVTKQASTLIQGVSDFDGDGVPNYKDCQPLNPKKQDVEPNILMRRRIERLPIYVTDNPISSTERLSVEALHLSDVRARRYAPIARKQILSILKRYPDLITQIERKRPRAVLVTSKPDPEGEDFGVAYPESRGKGVIVIYALSDEYREVVKKAAKSHGIRRGEAAYSGGTLRHELEHIKQFRKVRRGEASASKLAKGEYEERPEERQAVRAEQRLHRKHQRKGSWSEAFRRLF